MSLIKPRTAPGTMELLPPEQLAFQRMLKVISDTYERYGFLPIETPVFEPVDVLLTKSGGETEKQVFFVQKTGSLQQGRAPELALRFDLTVPLARYVAEHEHELAFPFRRYQMQRSYRGERTQRGRLNEFYQCDIDVIGKDTLSPKYDAEIPAIICDVFEQLAFGDFTVNYSNRKILTGLLQSWDLEDIAPQILREIDKMDKVGPNGVVKLIHDKTSSHDLAVKLVDLLEFKGSFEETLKKASDISGITQNENLTLGIADLIMMGNALAALGVPEQRTRLNLGIVRGLDYYTGTVYETTVDAHPEFGSICSGGRYENLAGHYTKSKLPGVGISIGASRLFDQLRATDWIRGRTETTTEVLVTQLDESLFTDYLALAADLRRAGINTEIMLEGGKIQKQMKYADRAGISHVVLMGADEKAKGTVTLKNLKTGEQKEIPAGDLITTLRP